MATIINDGWLYLTDGTDILRLFFKECMYDIKVNPTIKHYYGGANLGYDLLKKWLEFKFIEVTLGTTAKFEDALKYLQDFQAGGPFSLKLQIQDNPSDDFLELDGTNETITVMIKKNGIRDIHKVSAGHQYIYKIGLLLFEQAG